MDKYDLLYQKYKKHMSKLLPDYIESEKKFESRFATVLEEMNLIALNDSCLREGFLHYKLWTDEFTHCHIPVFGYYAENEKTMLRLFQKLAETIVRDGMYDFSVNIYSDDVECLTAFHMMQFGNMSEHCVKILEDKNLPPDSFKIKILDKQEIEKNWNEIWKATENIITHLKRSPVFYPGTEFTEDVYHNYFMSDTLELIVAFENDRFAGIIEWNTENCNLIGNEKCSANVGEVFVYPEYRGTGLSEKLLRFAESRAMAEGYKYMWVEHGTANPNARGFWNKYFTTCHYELVRRIGQSGCICKTSHY